MKAVGVRLAAATEDDLPELRHLLEEQLASAVASGMHRSVYLARVSLAGFERIAGRPKESVEALEALVGEWAMYDDTMIGSRQMKAAILAALVLSQIAAGDLEARGSDARVSLRPMAGRATTCRSSRRSRWRRRAWPAPRAISCWRPGDWAPPTRFAGSRTR